MDCRGCRASGARCIIAVGCRVAGDLPACRLQGKIRGRSGAPLRRAERPVRGQPGRLFGGARHGTREIRAVAGGPGNGVAVAGRGNAPGNRLSSPAAVRDYLRLNLAGLQHEVFFALWPDAQNCLIASADLFRGTLTQPASKHSPSTSRNSLKPELMHQASPLASTAGYNPGVLFRSVARPSEKKYGGQGRQQPQNAWQHSWQFSRTPRENEHVPGGF
jgi:hypothetical protein